MENNKENQDINNKNNNSSRLENREEIFRLWEEQKRRASQKVTQRLTTTTTTTTTTTVTDIVVQQPKKTSISSSQIDPNLPIEERLKLWRKLNGRENPKSIAKKKQPPTTPSTKLIINKTPLFKTPVRAVRIPKPAESSPASPKISTPKEDQSARELFEPKEIEGTKQVDFTEEDIDEISKLLDSDEENIEDHKDEQSLIDEIKTITFEDSIIAHDQDSNIDTFDEIESISDANANPSADFFKKMKTPTKISSKPCPFIQSPSFSQIATPTTPPNTPANYQTTPNSLRKSGLLRIQTSVSGTPRRVINKRFVDLILDLEKKVSDKKLTSSETPAKVSEDKDKDKDNNTTRYQSEETNTQRTPLPLNEPVFTFSLLERTQISPIHVNPSVEIAISNSPPSQEIQTSPPKVFQNFQTETPHNNIINTEHHVHFSPHLLQDKILPFETTYTPSIQNDHEQSIVERTIETDRDISNFDDLMASTPIPKKSTKKEKPRNSTPSRRSLRLSMKSAIKTPQSKKKISPKGRFDTLVSVRKTDPKEGFSMQLRLSPSCPPSPLLDFLPIQEKEPTDGKIQVNITPAKRSHRILSRHHVQTPSSNALSASCYKGLDLVFTPNHFLPPPHPLNEVHDKQNLEHVLDTTKTL